MLHISLTPHLTRLISLAHKDWDAHFARAVNSFRAAQLQVVINHSKNAVPDLEAYIELRRDASGLKMVFDLIELAEGLELPDEDGEEGEAIRRLKQCAADIIAWSLVSNTFELNSDII